MNIIECYRSTLNMRASPLQRRILTTVSSVSIKDDLLLAYLSDVTGRLRRSVCNPFYIKASDGDLVRTTKYKVSTYDVD